MKQHILFIFCMGLLTISCSNILDEFAKKDTDEARLTEAIKNMNKQNWSAAIANFENMSSGYLTKRDVKLQYAKAYAGRCGLRLLDLIENMSSLDSSLLYPILMEAFMGLTTTHADDCIQAESIMLSIASSATSRTPEENTVLAFISFAKMGAIFSSFADEDVVDGETDTDFNACSDTISPGVPDEYVRQVGTGLGIAITSLTTALSGGGLSGVDALDAATAACSALASLGAQFNFCGETDPSAFTADQVKAIRWTMMDNQVIGLGGAVNCDLSGVTCPVNCPL